MHRRTGSFLVLSSALSAGCPLSLPPEVVTCEEANDCATTGSTSSDGEGTPTTGGSVQTVTGDDDDTVSSSTTPDPETGSSGSTGEPEGPPVLLDGVVIPDYIRPGAFVGEIYVYSAVDNGKQHVHPTGVAVDLQVDRAAVRRRQHVHALPHRLPLPVAQLQVAVRHAHLVIGAELDGAPVREPVDRRHAAIEVADLGPDLVGERWQGDHVVDLDRLPDELFAPRFKRGEVVEREKGDDTVWWAGEISAWGKGPKNIGIGVPGDTAFAIAARPDVVAVCGSRAVPTPDELDALAVLLRPGELDEARLFDTPAKLAHLFTETGRDCAFAGDTLVLVGEAHGKHDTDMGVNKPRNRLTVIESDVSAAKEPIWTVAGIERGIQTRALALDLDDQGRYHLVGDRCDDICEPDGALWIYEPGGKLVDDNPLGPLGSPLFGPHDIACSPAGYDVIALGEMKGQSPVFKVQAFTPGDPVPLWTYLASGSEGLALAADVGPSGEVYAGGLADGHPAFKRIGG